MNTTPTVGARAEQNAEELRAKIERPPGWQSADEIESADARLCITIRQPWAWLIIRPDITDAAKRRLAASAGLFKDVENRTWSTPRRGWLYIHAGKVIEHDAIRMLNAEFEGVITIPPADQLRTGGIIGRVRLVNCVSDMRSVWAMEGKRHWLLADAEVLPFEPMRGQQGLFYAGEARR